MFFYPWYRALMFAFEAGNVIDMRLWKIASDGYEGGKPSARRGQGTKFQTQGWSACEKRNIRCRVCPILNLDLPPLTAVC